MKIACLVEDRFIAALDRNLQPATALREFDNTEEYCGQITRFKADAFLICADLPEPHGMYSAFNLRAIYDLKEPIIIASFRELSGNDSTWEYKELFALRGHYFLRLPFSPQDILALLDNPLPCKDTLCLAGALEKSGFFRRLEHALQHKERAAIAKLLSRTLKRYGH